MKKKILFFMMFIVVGFVLYFIMSNLFKTNNNNNKENVDYSEYDYFVDIYWTRSTEEDTEFLSFSSDGGFSYYCACGNPVADSDLCESYTYDEKTKTITVDCFEETKETINEIKILNYTDDSIELSFDGKIRKFVKEEE